MGTSRASVAWVGVLAGLSLLLLSEVHGRSHNPLVKEFFSTKWKKIAETRSLHPANLTALEILEEMKEEHFRIQVVINKREIKIYRDDQVVYEKIGVYNGYYVSHTGMHVVVLHPSRGHVMLARQFLTQEPSEDRNLVACLESLMPGNILIVAAVPEAVMFLGPDAVARLEEMGASRIRYLARHETWVMVAHTPTRPYRPPRFYPVLKPNVTKPAVPLGRVWAESLSLRRLLGNGTSSAVDMTTYVPKFEATKCAWHEDVAMLDQHKFCDSYDGYVRLCRCHDPVTSSLRYSASEIEIREVIPVAMLTAIKPFNFYRQLLNLLETPGAAQTPILVLIDGPQKEIIRLAKLFGLDVLIHRPQGEKGSTTLLNMHFRFSVHNVFNFFPGVDKAIILEDDLLLSPDFLSYFHQTAWLLDADPTITHVNAFSTNSYPDVAYDPTVLRRIEMFPQFGWMVKRNWAQEMFQFWVSENETADWDWWLSGARQRQGRDALLPEVSRTFHAGAAGAHVTGWAQEHLFNNMIFNQDPHVKLKGLNDLTKDRYEAKIRRDIYRAVLLNLTKSPCDGPILPPNQPGPFKIFVEAMTNNDEYDSFYVMQSCLHGYIQDTRDMFRGSLRFNLKGRVLYVVGCPMSPFCNSKIWVNLLRPSPELVNMVSDKTYPWQIQNYPPYYLERFPVAVPEEEFLMQNLLYVYHNGTRVFNKKIASVN
ncbi:protein O-linked-mannose beta-1,2-N-acetylglucosaminyltransferase 1-like [Penaeus chinensis]|uniref:protein O-linked-mannose beta-1,2-N-acetylglucosaminyltransferase 1-like n=1 Tax=Penaeus chinensis TaxID=139456 RepID=UPI001FB571CD|nr:protein O-linked-mannose beta-1,2-N-acetylglucosaminyltransferase 1-like [Penaeus chinensis]